MANTINYRIEPLSKENYDTWRLQAEAILIKSNLWTYVNGDEKRPDDSKEEELKTWLRNDQTAKSDLILIISPGELKNIKHCKTSKDVWDSLNNLFASKGPARKATLLKKLILTKMSETDNVRDHLNNFIDAVDKLSELDIIINDDLLSIMMLYSLSPSFENFRVAIESRDDLPKPDQLKIKILEEFEARRKDSRYVNHSNEDAFFSNNSKTQVSRKFKKNFQKEPKQNFNKMTCKNCGKHNHTTDRCWVKNKQNDSSYKTEEFCFSSLDFSNTNNVWCIDSGSTSHICQSKEYFKEISELPCQKNLSLASKNHSTPISGKGLVRLEANNSVTNLPDTLFVPDLTTNLLSVNKITEKGFKVTFDKKHAYVLNSNNEITLKANKVNGLYYAKFNKNETSNLITSKDKINEWHAKLGHINENDLKGALKNKTLDGLTFKSNEKLDDCEVCVQSKMTKLPFPARKNQKDLEILEIVHSDVCGPMKVTSPGGAKYFATFIDEKSRYSRVYFLKHKNEVLDHFKVYKQEVENFTNKKIKFFQSDNGKGEYCNNLFNKYLEENGIQRRLSAPYTPEQNGLAERLNRTLLDKARCMMVESKVTPMLWAEAIHTANYLRNRCPSRVLNHKTPFQLWLGRIPSVRHLHIFGNKTYVLKKGVSKGKFSPKAQEGIFVGYSEVSKAYRIWVPDAHKVVISRDVKVLPKFSESKYTSSDCDFYLLQENENNKPVGSSISITTEEPERNKFQEITQDESNNNVLNLEETEEYTLPEDNDSSDNQLTDTFERPQRQRKTPKWFDDYELSCIGIDESTNIDPSYWHEAIKEEIISQLQNNTWSITSKTKNQNVIDCKLILKEKFKSDGSFDRKKARLVAKGFAQRPNIDFHETFAPVAKLSSIRLVVATAIEKDMKLNQLDVSTAFLNGDIEEDIYMKLPPDLENYLQEIIAENKSDDELHKKAKTMLADLKKIPKELRICHLNKALYGLKQAGRQWFRKLDTRLKELEFQPSLADPCVYVSKTGNEIIAVYVDDLIIASKEEKSYQRIKNDLMKYFKMRDLGSLNHCIGIHFSYKNGTMVANQTKYIQDVLEKFKMADCKPIGTPMDPKAKLEKAKTNEDEHLPYQNLIGSLMFLAVATRPDIAYTVSYLSQFNNCYSREHWNAAKRVLRYLQGTKKMGLTFKKTGKSLTGFTDADWGSSTIDRRSFTGYCFIYANAAISWSSKKQRSVALSTAEAEYCAIADATKEAIHLKHLITDLNVPHKSITIFNDNQSAQHIASNPVVSAKSKHVDIKQHFVREKIEGGQIQLRYLPTNEMTADLLTKALAKPQMLNLITKLGLEEDCTT